MSVGAEMDLLVAQILRNGFGVGEADLFVIKSLSYILKNVLMEIGDEIAHVVASAGRTECNFLDLSIALNQLLGLEERKCFETLFSYKAPAQDPQPADFHMDSDQDAPTRAKLKTVIGNKVAIQRLEKEYAYLHPHLPPLPSVHTFKKTLVPSFRPMSEYKSRVASKRALDAGSHSHAAMMRHTHLEAKFYLGPYIAILPKKNPNFCATIAASNAVDLGSIIKKDK